VFGISRLFAWMGISSTVVICALVLSSESSALKILNVKKAKGVDGKTNVLSFGKVNESFDRRSLFSQFISSVGVGVGVHGWMSGAAANAIAIENEAFCKITINVHD
jgi:hypothetical protein